MDVSSLMQQPEGKTVEFKQDASSLKPILKTIVAFSNTAGGILVIGRKDDGEIMGITDPLLQEERLSSTIAENIVPLILPDIDFITIKKKTLIIIQVSRVYGPCYLKQAGPIDGVFVRLGSTNRVAGPELIEELQRQRSQKSFDMLPCHGTAFKDFDQPLLKSIASKCPYALTQPKLKTLNLLIEEQDKFVPSNAGIILFGKNEVRNRFFPDARVSCGRFRGRNKAQFLDRLDIQGGISGCIDEVLHFIERNTRLAAEIKSIRRRDIPEYSAVALREALLNALLHADYSLKGTRITVAIFDNRLEIRNPGMLPLGMTIEDLKSGVSRIRNHVIARVFSEVGWIEGWGGGYQRIAEACLEGGYPIPEWREVSFTTEVIFYPHPATQEERRNLHKPTKKGSDLSKRQIIILSIVQQREKTFFKEIMEQMPSPPSERTVRNDLTALRKKNLIASEGHGRGAFWYPRSKRNQV
jgi:ATP-dependent DNA helicase RecG